MEFFFHRIADSSDDNSNITVWNKPSVEDLSGAFAESLLFGDRTTVLLGFSAVSTLIDWFGVGLFEELLHDGSIRFAFSEALTTAYITNENIRALNMKVPPGLAALQGTSQRHTTPQGRAFQEISENTGLPRKVRRDLARTVARHTVVIKEDVHGPSYEAARSDFTGVIGQELALPVDMDPDSGDLPDPHRRRYLNLAGANVNVRMAAALGCGNLIADNITARVLQQRVADALASVSVSSVDYRMVLQFEEVPDLGRLLRSGRLDYRKLVELRRTREAEEFRKWFNSVGFGPGLADTSIKTDYGRRR